MQNVYKRALEVMEENFGHIVEMCLGSVFNDIVSVRELNVYYKDGKMYVLSRCTNTLMRDIAVCPNVGLSHGPHNFRGVARSLGHPTEEGNQELRKILKKEFSMNYDEYVKESDPDMRIVEISLTDAETFTRYHRYEIDFVGKTAHRDYGQPLFIYR